MGFKENLLQKCKINQLAKDVLNTIGPADSEKRIDRELMRQLLEMGHWTHRRERDLDMYIDPDTDEPPSIIVLDNELKIYRTTVNDVALRKSPTTKEMISIRNAIKILNDKDVVISRKADTLEHVRTRLIEELDLSYTHKDIEALAQDGRDSLQQNYADGVLETLSLFAELLGWQTAPAPFQLPHHRIWGRLETNASGEALFGPFVSYSLMHAKLTLFEGTICSKDKASMEAFRQSTATESKSDEENLGVWDALRDQVPPSTSTAPNGPQAGG
jgi:hypothetical protein